MFVLLTKENNYFVEFLCGELAISSSITEAMVFNDEDTAQKFKAMLYTICKIETSVNTFIK